MPRFRFYKSHLKPFFTILVMTLITLLTFNNCGKISSQTSDFMSNASTGSLGNPNSPNTPVNPNNPYVLQCIISSDGARVSSALTSLVDQRLSGTSNKLTSLDWDQTTDLIVYLDNQCLKDNNYSDPILDYVDLSQDHLQLKQSVYNIKKESVSNLTLFIKQALDSECLIQADKNYILKISQTSAGVADTHDQYQYFLQSGANGDVKMGASTAMMDQIFNYVENSTYAANNKKVKVAVIDTGADFNNPDLKNLIAAGFNTTDTPSMGFDKDSGYHGTHVAGLVAAEYRNGFGVRGAYGKHVELYIYRATNNGETFGIAALVNAINSAVQNNVDIINMSLSTSDDIPSLRQAISAASNAGKIIVVAAGNDGQQLSTSFTTYPAMYSTSIPGVITVGSVDSGNNQRSTFSNYSSTYVNILAPGSHRSADGAYPLGILSTLSRTVYMRDSQGTYNHDKFGAIRTGPSSLLQTLNIGSYHELWNDTNGDDIPETPNTQGTYGVIHGTSMAAPLVSGSIAMVLSMARSRNVTFTRDEIKSILTNGSLSKNEYSTFSTGGKYLNTPALFTHASQQIQNKMGTSPPPPPPPPPPPSGTLTINVQPSSKQVVRGERIEFSVTATGTGTMSYQWYKNGFAITGANTRSLTFNSAAEADGASYRVQVSNSSASVSSNSVDLKVALRYCN